MTRRTFAALLVGGGLANRKPGVSHSAPRDVPLLSGKVSGRTPEDMADGIFDLARGTAIAVVPGSAAHQTLKELLGVEVDVFVRVKN